MTKINSGITGGFSGSIHRVTGYNRKGKSIITARPTQQNKTLHTWQVERNNFRTTVLSWQSKVSAQFWTRWFVGLSGTRPLDERIAHVQQYWRDASSKKHGAPCLLANRTQIQTMTIKRTWTLSTHTLKIGQRNVQGGGVPALTTFRFLLVYNFNTKEFSFTFVSAPPLSCDMNVSLPLSKSGDKILINILFPNNNVPAPTYIAGSQTFFTVIP